MSDLLSYKNYNGTVEYSKEDGCLFGKVVGIKSLLSYEGNSVQELEQDFQNTLKKCRRISVADLKKISLRMTLLGRSLRLIAPLL